MKLRLFAVAVSISACAHSPPQTKATRAPSPPSTASPPVKTSTDSTREYTGEWVSGFESSEFRGCNGTMPAKVWATLAPGAAATARWSDSTGSAASPRIYYVRVRGILRGPAMRRGLAGGYGRLGNADYELYVTRVLEVKPPGQPNCSIRR